jgi:hypothetical protein
VWTKFVSNLYTLLGQDIFKSRRFILGAFGIACLTFLGYTKGQDVGSWISAIVVGVAGASAYQGSKKGVTVGQETKQD